MPIFIGSTTSRRLRPKSPLGTFQSCCHTRLRFTSKHPMLILVLLSGHTHGGQICLPGGIPITLDSVLPRHMGSGTWKYRNMIGYTSVGAGSSIVSARFNCPPEITVHRLRVPRNS